MSIRIHNIGGYVLNQYLLETPCGVVAIDTGYPGGFAKFRARFERKWPLSQLKYIFLTHHHDDHAGFLADLLAHTSATVVAHAGAAAPLARGRSDQPPGAGYSSGMASLFGRVKHDFSFPPVQIDDTAVLLHSEQEQCFKQLGLPLQIVFLPGHTADSIGLFLPETHQLFCGDAAMNAIISVARHTIWIEDAQAFGCSWDKMLALSPSRLYPSHGAPFAPSDLTKYRHFLDGKALLPPP